MNLFRLYGLITLTTVHRCQDLLRKVKCHSIILYKAYVISCVTLYVHGTILIVRQCRRFGLRLRTMTHTHARARACMHASTHTRTPHTHTHTRTHARARAHACTHARTHTRVVDTLRALRQIEHALFRLSWSSQAPSLVLFVLCHTPCPVRYMPHHISYPSHVLSERCTPIFLSVPWPICSMSCRSHALPHVSLLGVAP